MASSLKGDSGTQRPSESRLSGSVPISIAIHLVIMLLLLIIPLVATDALPPLPGSGGPAYVRAVPLPPPAPAVHISNRARVVTREPASGAPTSAPDRISAETPAPAVPLSADPGVDDGTIGGIGSRIAAETPAPVRPPEPPRPSGPVRIADLPRPPMKVLDVRPAYPEVARSARLEGTVVIEAVIDTLGRVTNCRVVKSAPLFDQSALDAVSQWRYTPSTYNGRTVAVLMTITVHFALR